MKLLLLFFSGLATYCSALPFYYDNKNVVTVPPNCPVGQQWINGQCRDIWRLNYPHNAYAGQMSELQRQDNSQLRNVDNMMDRNVVTVPTNCPDGQEYVNGECRDIWRRSAVTPPTLFDNMMDRNVVTVPTNCPDGQEYVNGQCRDIWRRNVENFNNMMDRNVVTVPTNCPNGQEYVNGQCRDIWRRNAVTPPSLFDNMMDRNVVTVPTNCPDGQEYVNGQCRDIWRRNAVTPPSVFDNMIDRNVVTVPTNCPDGQEYVNGQCRDIWRRSSTLLQKITSYWKGLETQEKQTNPESLETIRGIISVPNQCPTGQRPDALGICRPILD